MSDDDGHHDYDCFSCVHLIHPDVQNVDGPCSHIFREYEIHAAAADVPACGAFQRVDCCYIYDDRLDNDGFHDQKSYRAVQNIERWKLWFPRT